MTTPSRLAFIAFFTACARTAAPPAPPASARPAALDAPRPAAPDAAAPDVAAPPDAPAVLAESALLPGVLTRVAPLPGGRWSRRVVVAEVAVRHADAAGVRFAVIEHRCEDLVPRGGSDCWDLGYHRFHATLRAVDLGSGRRLWERDLRGFARAYTAARVEADVLVLDTTVGVERFATRDGSPMR
ncbi:MAG: hypothetical protein U0324_31000 [Polyangiales bacterium]